MNEVIIFFLFSVPIFLFLFSCRFILYYSINKRRSVNDPRKKSKKNLFCIGIGELIISIVIYSILVLLEKKDIMTVNGDLTLIILSYLLTIHITSIKIRNGYRQKLLEQEGDMNG